MRLIGDSFKAQHQGGECPVCNGPLCRGELQAYIRPNSSSEIRAHHRCLSDILDQYRHPQQTMPATQADSGELLDAIAALIESHRQR